MEEKRGMNIDESERKRRSELAKQLHERRDPVTGRRLFGGSQKGSGRPKKRRATEIINDQIEKNALEYFQRLHDIAMSKKADAVSIQAIQNLIAIANKETDIQVREDRNLDSTSTEELIELVASRYARLIESGKLPTDFEGTAEEVTDYPELDEGNAEQDESEGSSDDGPASTGSGTSAFTRRTTN